METTKKYLRERKLGVVGTAVLMALLLVFLGWMCYNSRDAYYIFYRVFSGQLFAEQWDTMSPEAPFVLPEPGRAYVVLVGIAVIVLPYLALVRTICARRTRLEYWIFVIPTALVCLFLICINTLPVCVSIKWMDVVGVTSARTYSLLFGLYGYIIILWFFFWAIRSP